MSSASKSKPSFRNLRVASFETRRATEMKRMLEQHEARVFMCPSVKEVPLESNEHLVQYANDLIAGKFDIVILLTGVGLQQLVEAVQNKVNLDKFLEAFDKATTICRGPKPVKAMKDLGLTPTYQVPQPNTWRELLEKIDEEILIVGRNVAVQEYGVSNDQLLQGLRDREAEVTSIPIYRWELPDDLTPIEQCLERISAGQMDVLLFTSSPQVIHLMEVADQLLISEQISLAMESMVIGSIGPTTSQCLREAGLHIDFEPQVPKMGQLVAAAAECSWQMVQRRRGEPTQVWFPPDQAAAPRQTLAHPEEVEERQEHQLLRESVFLKACRREPVEYRPIWLMRQAGRYMAEYREVRSKLPFLEFCKRPDLCTQVMVDAVNKLGVDAAIIFADLLPILEPMGLEVEFVEEAGPKIHNPIRETKDLARFHELEDVSSLQFVMDTVKMTREAISPKLPIIGFAGAPFTLASYAIEGGGSKNYLHTKTLMYRDEGAWAELMRKLSNSIVRYVNAQIKAGAQAIQLFDSWVGCLGVDDYRRYVLPYIADLITRITPGVPVIHFANGNPALLPSVSEAGGTVIGVDWRIRLDDAWDAIGRNKAVQGNLDPLVLMAEPAEIERHVREILKQTQGTPGHIFNLGHGILPQTPVDNAIALVDMVHDLSQRGV